ncbi:helix-turn-helix transcriptional regulator [Dyadobacter endophyticus]|uniref:helix-turn-helix transcriptional regulator n=1 Tax=Dyadobacter endophyticus TaxID=1749036 RepID=UPI003CE79284
MEKFAPNVTLDRFLRLPEVLKLIPVSKATWWNGCRSGRFPKPYKLGPRTTAWKASEIQNCINRYSSAVWRSET